MGSVDSLTGASDVAIIDEDLEPAYIGVVGRMGTNSRPIVSPEPFNGEGGFSDWLDHFEGVAKLNKWKEEDKVLWLRVRLTGRAQSAYKQLKPEVREGPFENLSEALRKRFEPDSRRELYGAEFQTRRKKRTESWADFGDDLCALADKAFPTLGTDGRQQLALHQYLASLSNPQVSFAVRQRKPTTVEEAVAATLEVESFLIPAGGIGRVAQVGAEEQDTPESLVAAVKTQQDTMIDLMSQLVQRVEKLEIHGMGPGADQGANQRRPYQVRGKATSDPKPVVCFKCGQEGHYQRGCAQRSAQGNGRPSV